jgi:hypothetical protein
MLVYASAVPENAELPSDTVVARSGDVLAERVLDETLVLHLTTDRCTRLNHSGSLLWEALDSPRRLEELCRHLEREFALEPSRARADAEAFVRNLSARRLVTVGPTAAA